ncbi:autotransporter assembly complex protein TamA [Marilutibacter chinensis]|uniref:autotransporter assembly complex protein TamA n=1 Tax=Marilutibacter chinensis TaxID=2912247 RepID=UPI00210202BD|nr:autotransporter assembly complex family protein [Lysobacter chinensis]
MARSAPSPRPRQGRTFAIAIALAASGFCGAAFAARVGTVTIVGLDETMTENVELGLSLVDAKGEELSGRRLGYMVRQAEDETRKALEPFGYYDPQITVERRRDNGTVSVTITVDPGETVKVRRSDIAIIGEGARDRYLKEDLAAFKPAIGETFVHPTYEASKVRITRRLAERGYFDAEFLSRRVEVTRAEQAADIDLVWESGRRYDMGPITFSQEPERIIRDSLLEQMVYWEEGSYYHQGKLDRFRQSLSRLDYFSGIDIVPQPDKAVDGRVPVQVTLTPAKRSVYTAGVSYSTLDGAGIRLGLERRYLNDRGHKLNTQIDWAQYKKAVTVQYRIPAFAWRDGWYIVSGRLADEQSDYIDSRRVEFIGSRTGQINRYWTATASMHLLRERWRYFTADDGDGALTMPAYQYATFAYPALRAAYVDADNTLFPRDAVSAVVELKAGAEALGSDANFAQAYGSLRWYRGIGERDRLIARAEAGHTFTDDLVNMPPSLRYYAGGDRSIRGYATNEVGPSVETDHGRYYTGGKNLITGSVEYEHYFNDSWGAAVFVDSGSAFDDTPDWRTGVGIGLRWISPVGPLRLDIATGLDDPDSSYEFYLNIGADL